MKKIFSTLLLAVSFTLALAQAPQAMNYQAVARSASGAPLPATVIGLKLSVVAGSPTGIVEYAETQSATTNNLGLFNVSIGQGTPVTSAFNAINWGASSKYLKVEIDPNGGTNYTLSGTSPLLSVPYALYAANSNANITAGTGISVAGNTVTNTGDLSNTNELQTLSVSGSTLAISNGNSVTLPTGANYTGGTGINVAGTVINNTGDLSATNEIQTLTLAGTTLSISSGNSVVLPSGGTNYTAGTGIGIAGTVITNTGDLSTTNELQTLSISGTTLSISNGNSITLPAGTTYTAGTGINIIGNVINNSAPDQIVSLLAGANVTVTGSYPTFTIAATNSGTTYTAGTGIGIAGTVITNTAPDQIVNLLAGANVTITGTYPTFTIASTGGTGGTAYTAGTGINITGTVINNTAPDQIVTLTPGSANVTITGAYPNFVIDATGGTGTTYTAGTGISITGTTINNTSPDVPVTLTAGTGIAITGSYPNFTVTSTGGTGGTNYWTLSGTDIYNNNTGNVGVGGLPTEPFHAMAAAGGVNSAIIYGQNIGTAAVDVYGVMGTSIPQDYFGFGGFFEGGWKGVAAGVNPTGANDYIGVHGVVDGGTGINYGVVGAGLNGGFNYGVVGSGNDVAVMGLNDGGGLGLLYAEEPYGNAMANGIYGNIANAVAGATEAVGVFGSSTATGEDFSIGVYGIGSNANLNQYGVYGYSDGQGLNNFAIGIFGDVGLNASFIQNYAGYFAGDLETSGNLIKAAGTFKIDHPLDPENKYLFHSFVESPDMMNIYNGNITTDANGLATVAMPAYFEAENIDFRYQLTCMGTFAQAIVKTEIANNQFIVQTDKPNVKVSWMVTGVRNDKYAQAHRVQVEVNKKGAEIGKYMHPELFGKGQDQSIPGLMRAGVMAHPATGKTTRTVQRELPALTK